MKKTLFKKVIFGFAILGTSFSSLNAYSYCSEPRCGTFTEPSETCKLKWKKYEICVQKDLANEISKLNSSIRSLKLSLMLSK